MNINSDENKQTEILFSHALFSALFLLMCSSFYENSLEYGIFVPERSWEDLVCILSFCIFLNKYF